MPGATRCWTRLEGPPRASAGNMVPNTVCDVRLLGSRTQKNTFLLFKPVGGHLFRQPQDTLYIFKYVMTHMPSNVPSALWAAERTQTWPWACAHLPTTPKEVGSHHDWQKDTL
jgi:hypothetical protein